MAAQRRDAAMKNPAGSGRGLEKDHMIIAKDTTGNVINPQMFQAAPVRETVEVTKTVADWFHHSVVRGREGIFSEIVVLTPEVAKLLLAGTRTTVGSTRTSSLRSRRHSGGPLRA
jgi:hypothetical protein